MSVEHIFLSWSYKQSAYLLNEMISYQVLYKFRNKKAVSVKHKRIQKRLEFIKSELLSTDDPKDYSFKKADLNYLLKVIQQRFIDFSKGSIARPNPLLYQLDNQISKALGKSGGVIDKIKST